MKFPQVLLTQIILYISHRLRAGHRMGMGIHPPFAFTFIKDTVFGKDIPGLEVIEELRNSLSGNRELLEIEDYGAGSRFASGNRRSVQNLVKRTAVSRKKGNLLARIAAYMHPGVIIELGTGMGFSSMYMGMGSPDSKIFSCEGSKAIANLARKNMQEIGADNVHISVGKFMDWLPGMLSRSYDELMVFLDGDHRGERLLEYCSIIIEKARGKAVLVIDDIHWSTEMYTAWKMLLKREEVSLGLEIYNTGIVFVGCDIQKDHFIIRF